MSKLLEIKKLLRLGEVRKIEPVEITVAVFAHGNCNQYKFLVQYIGKTPYGSHAYADDYVNHVVDAYGIVTFDNGSRYKECYKLTYTDDAELEKLIQPIKEGVSGSCQIFYNVLKNYCYGGRSCHRGGEREDLLIHR